MKFFNLFGIIYVFGITFCILNNSCCSVLGFEKPIQANADQIAVQCFTNIGGPQFKNVEVSPQGPNDEIWKIICLRQSYGPLTYTISAVHTASDLSNEHFDVNINTDNHQTTIEIVPGTAKFFYEFYRSGRYLELYANTSTSAIPSPQFQFKLETPSERHANCLFVEVVPPFSQTLPMITLSSNELCNH